MFAPRWCAAPRRGLVLLVVSGLVAFCVGVSAPPPADAAPAGPGPGQVTAGDGFICAARSDATVACWGYNPPAPPPDLGPVTLVSAGFKNVCAVRTDQGVRCWGENTDGEATPPPNLTAVALSRGQSRLPVRHMCAVRPDGSVACWGQNTSGQTDVPADLGGVTEVVAGDGHTCALRSDRTVRCWGVMKDADVPADLGPVTGLGATDSDTCAIRTDATVRCWGQNGVGEISLPADLDSVVALAGVFDGMCALRSGGDVRCWGGAPLYGAVTPPAGLPPARAIATGPKVTCVTLTTGRLRCWGIHAYGSAPAFTGGPPPSPVRHTAAYSYTFTADAAPAARLSLTAGTLPPGLSLDPATGVLSGTPTAPGTYSATVTATNEFFEPDATRPFTIEVTNAAPTAGNDSYDTAEDTPLSIAVPGVKGNDTDADGDPFSLGLVHGPDHGHLDLHPDGSFGYTPAADYHGADSFTYVATDPLGAASAVATVTFAIASVNDPPVAHDDTASTAEDTPVPVPVTANDTDADGDPLSALAGPHPLHGRVVCSGAGCTYTPDRDFNGHDSFSYTAVDGHGGAAPATVGVTVTPVNDPPVAVDDADTTPEDTPVTISALANDSDVDGDTLQVSGYGQPANGLVVCSGATCRYIPALNFNGTDSFPYTVSDGNGGTAQAVARITISAENDAPVATADRWTTAEDGPLTVPGPGVLGNDRDADGDGLSARLVTGASHGQLDLRPDGSFAYTPAADFNGTDSFTYQANDGAADSDPVTVTLAVTAVNDVPVASDDTADTNEGVPAAIALVANDTDADGDVLALADVGQPAHGTVSCSTERICTYRSRLPFSGVDSFAYTVSDGKGGQATATVRVTVTPVRGHGYWLLARDGRVYPFGTASSYGDAVDGLAGAAATDLDPTPSLNGYWITDDRGQVHPVGDAGRFGSVDASALRPGEAVAALAVTGTGQGYWVVSDQGRVFAFGDAHHHGDLGALRLAAPIVDGVASPGGAGYLLVAADGGVFSFGDAAFAGSLGGRPLAGAVVSIAADPDGRGYWLAAADGGIFAFDAPFRGAVPPTALNQPLAEIVVGEPGYLLAARDGGVFAFGPPFLGSLGNQPPGTPVVAVGAR